MSKQDHVFETPATQWLKAHKVAFTEHPYEYLEHGGAQHSAEVLGFDSFAVVKTLVMQDQDDKPLLVLMHGNRKVSTKNLARQIGAKSAPNRSSPARLKQQADKAATWSGVYRPSARVRRCQSISSKPFLACLTSPSMAGDAAS